MRLRLSCPCSTLIRESPREIGSLERDRPALQMHVDRAGDVAHLGRARRHPQRRDARNPLDGETAGGDVEFQRELGIDSHHELARQVDQAFLHLANRWHPQLELVQAGDQLAVGGHQIAVALLFHHVRALDRQGREEGLTDHAHASADGMQPDVGHPAGPVAGRPAGIGHLGAGEQRVGLLRADPTGSDVIEDLLQPVVGRLGGLAVFSHDSIMEVTFDLCHQKLCSDKNCLHISGVIPDVLDRSAGV